MSTPKRAVVQKSQKRDEEKPLTDKVRTTLMISEEVDVAVEVCAAKERKQKSVVVDEVLKDWLTKRGYLPI